MKRISLVIYEDAVLSSVSGVIDVLGATNALLERMDKPPAFQVELVAEKAMDVGLLVPARLQCTRAFHEVTDTDLILVPAFYVSPDMALQKNKALVEWLRDMRAKKIEIASLCLGSYFLAESGILNGRSCASHWMSIDDMKRRYPDIDIVQDIVMSDKDGIYTSGGALLSWNLILYIIEKFCGRDISINVSKQFNLDFNRESQSQFIVFQGQRQHEDQEILRAQSYIEKNYHAQISVDQIAEQANMSKRNFIRRFKNATQNTPLEYLQRVKIEYAKKALEKNTENVSSLMYEAGYNDLKTFRKVFKQITGLTPQEYRKKYNRSVAVYA